LKENNVDPYHIPELGPNKMEMHSKICLSVYSDLFSSSSLHLKPIKCNNTMHLLTLVYVTLYGHDILERKGHEYGIKIFEEWM
jgi:hypothetical protein